MLHHCGNRWPRTATVMISRHCWTTVTLSLVTLFAVASATFPSCDDTTNSTFYCSGSATPGDDIKAGSTVSSSANICVHAEQICDNVVDCPTGDDERNCGYVCNFEALVLTNSNTNNNNNNSSNNSRYSASPCHQWSTPPASDNLTGFVITNSFTARNQQRQATPLLADVSADYHRTAAAAAAATVTPGGPAVDRSLGTAFGGFALFVNSAHSATGVGTSADLVSRWYGWHSAVCRRLSFSVQMYGAGVGQFHVYVRLHSSETLSRVWSVYGDRGSRWVDYSVTLGVLPSSFQVVFRAVRGTGDTGYIALDMISLAPCSPDVAPPGECQMNELRCSTRLCVRADRVCDGEFDCLEGDDEQQQLCTGKMALMTRCDFERDLCRWKTHVVKSELEWKRNSGKTPTEMTGPSVDHTFANSSGHYVYMDASEGSVGSRAILESPVFPPPPSSNYNYSSDQFNSCKLRFFYHVYGRHVGELSVNILETRPRACTQQQQQQQQEQQRDATSSAETTSCSSQTGTDGYRVYRKYWTARSPSEHWDGGHDVWLRASISLPYLTRGYVIQLVATRGLRYRGDMAVDDISLTGGCFDSLQAMNVANETQTDHWPDDGFIAHSNSTRYEFGACGNHGRHGPTQFLCDIAYQSNSNLRGSVTVLPAGGLLPAGIQAWTVPHSALYSITATGACGGTGLHNPTQSRGGYVHGRFQLNQGEVLHILVGQEGESACKKTINAHTAHICQHDRTPNNYNNATATNVVVGGGGGAGGATFVFRFNTTTNRSVLLLAAGGGGGRSARIGQEPINANGGLGPPGPGESAVGNNDHGPGAGGGWHARRDEVGSTDGRGVINLFQLSADGALGGLPCPAAREVGWQTRGGFGGGGGGCNAGGGGGGYTGGRVSLIDQVDVNGYGGSSYISRESLGANYASGVTFGDGSVEVAYSVDCPCQHHCRYTDVSVATGQFTCYCDGGFTLATDGIHCIDKQALMGAAEKERKFDSMSLLSLLGVGALLVFSIVAFIFIRMRRRQIRAKKSERIVRLCRLPSTSSSSQPVLLTSSRTAPDGSATTGPGMVTEYNPNYGNVDATKELGAFEHDLLEIPYDRLVLIRSVGHGAFGEVFQGLLHNMPGEPTSIRVAAKTLSGLNTNQAEMDFLMEALIMSKFRHPNIVRLIGVCFKHQPRMIVLELLDGGDIKTFLRQSRPTTRQPSSLTQLDLVRLSLDVALGCEYLEQNHFIHRDIAARNCLLTCKGPERVAKIADFGMARDIYSADYYRKGGRAMLPVKWMPPEAFLDGIFTSKTDVWSYGVLLWEVFSLGYMPYPGCGNQEVMQLVAAGNRLDPPRGCPAGIYVIMTSCWRAAATERPSFSDVIAQLQQCLQDPEIVHAPYPAGQSGALPVSGVTGLEPVYRTVSPSATTVTSTTTDLQPAAVAPGNAGVAMTLTRSPSNATADYAGDVTTTTTSPDSPGSREPLIRHSSALPVC